MGGNSRNNANGLTSKTHTDSMIYNGNSNMNSFQGGLNQSGLSNIRLQQNKTLVQTS